MRYLFAFLLAVWSGVALAQVTPGTSPLSIPKGGTGGATAAAARTSLGITATGADTTYNFRANNLSDVASAPTARTNLGLAIGTNVEAWDADLDCLAALSTTGVVKRTGAGTCSAGAAALSDLAIGTQDTVIGYFGSTTASAVAISNCTGGLTYSTSTHTFGCNVGAGTGTVTSAQISAGFGISVAVTSGANPCTSACNLTVTNTGVVAVKKQVFTATGTYTPSTGMVYAIIECVGGGAGGGGAATATSGFNGGGGGGAGGYSRILVTAASIGASKAVTIGTGGAGGTPGFNNGTAGGDTSVGVLCVGKGATAGTGANGTSGFGSGGAGGVAGTGDLAIPGEPGGSSVFVSAITPQISASTNVGGNTVFGAGGKTGPVAAASAVSGVAGTGFGSGGSGGLFHNIAGSIGGGAGQPGIVFITEYTNQ